MVLELGSEREGLTSPLRFARKIQTAYRRWKAQQFYEELKQKVRLRNCLLGIARC